MKFFVSGPERDPLITTVIALASVGAFFLIGGISVVTYRYYAKKKPASPKEGPPLAVIQGNGRFCVIYGTF